MPARLKQSPGLMILCVRHKFHNDYINFSKNLMNMIEEVHQNNTGISASRFEPRHEKICFLHEIMRKQKR